MIAYSGIRFRWQFISDLQMLRGERGCPEPLCPGHFFIGLKLRLSIWRDVPRYYTEKRTHVSFTRPRQASIDSVIYCNSIKLSLHVCTPFSSQVGRRAWPQTVFKTKG